jgi:propanol-preferring alcohol dehydrogenase
MRAFQFVEAQKPAELREVPVPEPGAGQVLIKIGGAGACHSDLHILEAPPKPGPKRAPFTFGHENAGLGGPGVTGFAKEEGRSRRCRRDLYRLGELSSREHP